VICLRNGGYPRKMERLRLYKTEAIVLKHIPIGEADRLVTLYTPHLGKVRAVARGARRTKSKLAGHLEPLTRVQVLIRRGKTLDTISQGETVMSNIDLRNDLWRMSCGLYMAELIERFTQEQMENLSLYRLFRDSLASAGVSKAIDLLLRSFELRMLHLVGYRPELQRCVECSTPLSPGTNFFSPSAGGVLCPDCRGKHSLNRPLSLNALKVLRLLARGGTESAEAVKLSEDLAIELEGTLRQYIRYLLEQEVKSTEFLDLLRRESLGGVLMRGDAAN